MKLPMNKNIQAVLEIEKKAQAIHTSAIKKAEQLPLEAEREAQILLEKTRSNAEEEARQLIEAAKAQDDGERILAEAVEKSNKMKSIAINHFDRAVSYVLDRVAGSE
jgi:vacuolar-type H+-ATPase subunit H